MRFAFCLGKVSLPPPGTLYLWDFAPSSFDNVATNDCFNLLQRSFVQCCVSNENGLKILNKILREAIGRNDCDTLLPIFNEILQQRKHFDFVNLIRSLFTDYDTLFAVWHQLLQWNSEKLTRKVSVYYTNCLVS